MRERGKECKGLGRKRKGLEERQTERGGGGGRTNSWRTLAKKTNRALYLTKKWWSRYGRNWGYDWVSEKGRTVWPEILRLKLCLALDLRWNCVISTKPHTLKHTQWNSITLICMWQRLTCCFVLPVPWSFLVCPLSLITCHDVRHFHCDD